MQLPVAYLNFSRMGIRDEDMPEIYSIVSKYPNLKFLILNFNPFEGTPETCEILHKLFNEKPGLYIEITGGTSFVHSQKKDILLQFLDKNLVFVNKNWFSSGNWKEMVPLEKHSYFEKMFLNYYDEIEKNENLIQNSQLKMEVASITENGSKAFSSSGDACLNFFSKVTREMSFHELEDLFYLALRQDERTALKLLYHLRDCRGGKGEKELSIVLYKRLNMYVSDSDMQSLLRDMLDKGYACWNDVNKFFIFSRNLAVSLFAEKLKEDSLLSENENEKLSLAGKWAPSEGKQYDKFAREIAKKMKLSMKEYRKMLSSLRARIKILETNLVNKTYSNIVYEHVPSRAMNIHRDLFKKVDGDRFLEYLQKVKSGEKKINATGMQPHELLKNASDDVAVSQWNALVKKVFDAGSITSSLSICDTSNSMNTGESPSPLSVALALSIFLSDLNTLASLPFGGKILTFDRTPEWVTFRKNDTLEQKNDKLVDSNWGGSTNLLASFDLILDEAKRWNVEPEKMPKMLFIFSDMQFDAACPDFSDTHFQLIKKKYSDAGYDLPKIVFWNLNSKEVSVCATPNEKNVALLSGYSHSLFNAVVNNKLEDFTPRTVMNDVLEKYDPVNITITW